MVRNSTEPLHVFPSVFGVLQNVGDVDDLALQQGASGTGIASRFDWNVLNGFHEGLWKAVGH